MWHKIASLVTLAWREKGLAIEAVLMLAIARMLILFFPFSWWNGLMSIDRQGAVADKTKTTDREHHPSGRRIGRIVRMVARNVPFKAVCLPQAIAAQWMLSRREIASSIVIGADHSEDAKSFDLHAWLISESIIITGKREHQRFRAFKGQKAAKGGNLDGVNKKTNPNGDLINDES